jgi:cellulose synthase/poly-beta-1,6-N-acetylglucosamine synthase-like glycosyltransferase
VLSDGSTDATDAIAMEYAGRGVRLIRLPKGGKAAALNHGMEVAQGDVLFFTDVRQQLDPDCLRHIVTAFSDPKVGAVCGEMVILNGETHEEASVGLYWHLEKWMRRQLSATGSLLVVTGCLYAVRRHLAEPLPDDALGDDIYMPQAVLRKGSRVMFEPAARAYDYPTALDVEFRRKVRTLAALYQYLVHRGLGPRPFHFFSYKVSRLLLPYALLLIALGTPFLSAPWSYVVAGVQTFFYALALFDVFVPERTMIKRVSSAARTFCTLMWASVAAVSVLFVPPADLWKTTHVRQPKHRSVAQK